MQKLGTPHRAFSLIELLVVASIGVMLMGFTLPAVNSLLQGNQLDSASRTVMNLMTCARSEAIAQSTLTRFAVSVDWEDHPDSNYRKVSVWRCTDPTNPTPEHWQQISKWESIPMGVVIDPSFDSQYSGASGVSATSYLMNGVNSFPCTIGGKSVVMKYAEFLPTGAARMSPGSGSSFGLTLREGYLSNNNTVTTTGARKAGKAANWAMISTSTLTGRIKVFRP